MSEKLIREILNRNASTLNGGQMARVEEQLEVDGNMSYQELAKFLSPSLKASEADIYSFLHDRDKRSPADIDKNKPS